jgi:serine/threonine protein kinase
LSPRTQDSDFRNEAALAAPDAAVRNADAANHYRERREVERAMTTARAASRLCPVCRTRTEDSEQIFCAECQQLLPEAPPLEGRYALESSLGEGGFGHTYRAHDTRTGKPVAIKRVPLAQNGQNVSTTRKYFERELRLLSDLNTPGHPNIPEVLDTFSDEGAEYLVMKYVTGDTLRLKLQTMGSVPWTEVSTLLEQLLSALDYMHTRPEPVVHGDIKLDNIIEDETGRLFLVDFGLSRQQSRQGSWITDSGAAAGTPVFSSWDHWRGGPSPMSDMYALAMTAYVLLAGATTYTEMLRREQFSSDRFTPHPGLTLDEVRALKIPDDVQDLMLAATATEPRERPPAAEFLERLKATRESKLRAGIGPMTVTRPLVFPRGDAARTETEFASLADHHLDESLDFLYKDDTLVRWLETQCFRADLAHTVREIREQYPDHREALELVLQTLNPRRPAPKLIFDPPQLTVRRSFFSRSLRGQFVISNKGPGYAHLRLAGSHKKLKVTPDELALELNESHVVEISAPGNTLGRGKPLRLALQMARAKQSLEEEQAIEVTPMPWWYRIREVVMLAVTAAVGLWVYVAVDTWGRCVLQQNYIFLGCYLPPPGQVILFLQNLFVR